MEYLICLIIMTTAFGSQVAASCPAVCECPAGSPVCPPGVSAVPDGCGCCKVCAAQLNQDCSPMKPCDHHKGLECNYGNDVTVASGVCRAKSEGRTCEYNSRIYQNGESFRVRCKHQCTCLDGTVGCAPLCDYKLPGASPSCPFPQLLRMPRHCCFSVDCHKGTRGLPPKHHKKTTFPKRHQSKVERHPVLRPQENEPLLKNDIAPLQTNGWEGERGYNHLPVWGPLKKCPILTTEWSQCSRSCGMGISYRLSNNNPQCKLERETRLCTVRPCGIMTFPSKSQRGRRCSTTQKAQTPLRLAFGECVSVRLYRPKFCNVCSDERCCSPHRTHTVAVTFACPDGQRFQRSTMFIQSCKCSVEDCGPLNDVALPPQHWMYGDTHKFID